MRSQDVTEQVSLGSVDDEHVPIRKCVCGATFPDWTELLSIYADDSAWECPKCKRRLYFKCMVRAFELIGL